VNTSGFRKAAGTFRAIGLSLQASGTFLWKQTDSCDQCLKTINNNFIESPLNGLNGESYLNVAATA
jgi:hypothetical protein